MFKLSYGKERTLRRKGKKCTDIYYNPCKHRICAKYLKFMILFNPQASSLWTDTKFHAPVHITSEHHGWDMNPGFSVVNTHILSSVVLWPCHYCVP